MHPSTASNMNSTKISQPCASILLARPVRQLTEVKYADTKGLNSYMNDIIAAFSEVENPTKSLVAAAKRLANEVRTSYDKYDPELHPHFLCYIEFVNPFRSQEYTTTDPPKRTIAEACLEQLLSDDPDNTTELVSAIEEAETQLARDRKGKSQKDAILRRQHRRDKLAKEVVGLLETPENAYVFDVETQRRINLKPESLAALQDSLGGAICSRKRKAGEDVSGESPAEQPDDLLSPEVADQPLFESIPTTDVPGIFQAQFVDDEDLEKQKFKIFNFGYVYALKKAPDGVYRLIFAAAFLGLDHFDRHELAHIKYMYRWFLSAQNQAYFVVNNSSQNGDKTRGREGWLKMVGWRSNRSGPKKTGENLGPYVPKNDVEAYERIYRQSQKFSIIWTWLQKHLAPRAVYQNTFYLSHIHAPIFGDYRPETSDHMPGMGSNMAFSMADKGGRGYANTSHVDSDIDGTVEHRACVWTSGTWLNGTQQGKLISDSTKIRKGIRGGKFILPAYRFGIDLGAATVVIAIWRGGLDYHCTTSSFVEPESNVVRFGASVQTNRVVASKAAKGTGIWGLEERLANYES
ncbi:hypothetical protein RhiLY_08630 [Ceratobasidium sp. AG-Ba]|nr:hypothetical protein RhiLY_08630 [Ceratobasidium sp. AG-Ba]